MSCVCLSINSHSLSDLQTYLFSLSLQFTFASNAATIVGGCLVTNRYKLRLPAAFISAFVISVSSNLNSTSKALNFSLNHTLLFQLPYCLYTLVCCITS